MNCTVNVLCFKSKTLSNGEHPLMICVSKDGKRKYLSLGVSVNPNNWDFEKNKPKRNCPDKELIQKIINDKITEYSTHIMDLKASNKDFTASNVIKKQGGILAKTTVGDYIESHIRRLEGEKRLKYASTFKELKNSMTAFNDTLSIYFSDMDVSWLKNYELWLKTKGLNLNSIGVRFRTLRVLYNCAIEDNLVKQEAYPFKTYKVSKLHLETAKRAITKDEVKKIISFNTENRFTQLAIDVFYFSYLCAGINFKDMAYLSQSNIVENQLEYYRKKTKKLIRVPIRDEALKIIQKYSNKDRGYLFPIFAPTHKTEEQKANRLNKALKVINRNLKKVGMELCIPIDLTTYVARHSYATVLKRAGVSTSIISESLGHSSEKITQIYLDSFENEQISDALKHLL